MKMEEENKENLEEEVPRKKNSFLSLVALLTAVALFILSIQAYFYLVRPQPVNVPKLAAVRQLLGPTLGQPFSSYQPNDLKKVLDETQDGMKQVANYIASKSCSEPDSLCQSKALFNFVRDEIRYVPDANFADKLENPMTTIKTGGADCEDMAMLLIALEKAVGDRTRLVFVPGHAFAQVSIPDYKGGDWVNLEATCKTCQFGQLPDEVAMQNKEYREL